MNTSASRARASARIQPYSRNRFFWQHRGRPTLLIGASDTHNLFQWAGERLVRQLDTLRRAGGNYVRNTMSTREEGSVQPFAEDGGRFDLERWNDEYWGRFQTFLRETGRRGIIVQIELWDRFDFARDPWGRNAFNPKNNLNYDARSSRLPEVVDAHPGQRSNPFFRTMPGLENNRAVLRYQETFVRRVLDYSLPHDHVLYCIDNETNESAEWGEYWARFIHDHAKSKGLSAQITQMWDPWDVNDPMHDRTFSRPDLYTFVDVSQNNHQRGEAHYNNPLKRRRSLAESPRPMNNTKIYGADGGPYGSTADGVARFWRNLFGGHASVRFHRPPSGLGLSDTALKMIRAARAVTSAIDWFACEPGPELLLERTNDGAYCMSQVGRACVVFFPQPGASRVRIAGSSGRIDMRWYSIDDLRWTGISRIDRADEVGLKTPGAGMWVALLRR